MSARADFDTGRTGVTSLRDFVVNNPLLAVATSASSAAVSFFEQLNVAIRVATGTVGLAIAVMTLMLQVRKWRSGRAD